MKKIYDCQQSFYIKGQTKGFEPTSILRHFHVLDENEAIKRELKYSYQDFQALWELVECGAVLNAETQNTLFGNRQIYFQSGLDGYTVKEKHFTEVTIWCHCFECPNVSMKTLLEELPAEELIDYLKERGLGLEMGEK